MQFFRLCRYVRDLWVACWRSLCPCWAKGPIQKVDCLRRWLLYVVLFILLVVIAGLTAFFAWCATDQPDSRRWGIAILYVIVVGHVGGGIFLAALRDWYMRDKPHATKRRIPPGFLGFFERLVFTVTVGGIVSFEDKGLATPLAAIFAAMAFWLGTKLASGWNRVATTDPKKATRLARGAMAALLTGVVNMAFAVVGGLIAAGRLDWPIIWQFLTDAAGGGR